MVNRSAVLIAGSVALLLLGGCAGQTPADESNLTAGMAKATITEGETTQARVLEVFGPPDLVTHRDDIQIWTYDKISYDVQSRQGYITVLFAGQQRQRTRSSSRSTMLILYFDENDIVQDYRMSVTRF